MLVWAAQLLIPLVVLLWIRRAMKGKKVAILGSPDEGTRRLISILKERARLTDDDVKEGPDYAHNSNHYHHWKKLFHNADFLIYHIRLDPLTGFSSLTERRILDDVSQFQRWRRERSKHFASIVVGRMDDLSDPSLDDMDKYDRRNFENNVLSSPLIDQAIIRLGGRNRARLVCGSLTPTAAAELVNRILSEVKEFKVNVS